MITEEQDRLGSVPDLGRYYPYGEAQTAGGNDQDKFATYYRDGTSLLDYARNRYYSSTLGRFTSADPYMANNGGSGDLADPGSWNRYGYVEGDPVNLLDPWGLQSESTDCSVYPNSPACSTLPACRVYPLSPQCWQQMQRQPPIPDCYRPKAPKGASVDANVQLVQAMEKTYLDEAMQIDPSHQQEAALGALVIVSAWWVNQIRPGGAWDYKRQGTYEEFGNFDFGATAAALGVPYYIGQNGAGLVNITSNVRTFAERILRKLNGDTKPLPDWWAHGVPLLQWPFGDDYTDALNINKGYAFYEAKTKGQCK